MIVIFVQNIRAGHKFGKLFFYFKKLENNKNIGPMFETMDVKVAIDYNQIHI